jgi:hypothetical protein
MVAPDAVEEEAEAIYGEQVAEKLLPYAPLSSITCTAPTSPSVATSPAAATARWTGGVE